MNLLILLFYFSFYPEEHNKIESDRAHGTFEKDV